MPDLRIEDIFFDLKSLDEAEMICCGGCGCGCGCGIDGGSCGCGCC